MAMYFVQHGKALAKDINPDRPLSDEGAGEVETMSAFLQLLELNLRNICHSGKTRAKETAQLFANHIGDGMVCDMPGMNPNDDVAEFSKALEDETMYVGHLPHMDKLVSYLTTGDEEAGVVEFTNAGVVCVEKENPDYRIEWYLTPSLCKR